MVSTKTIQSVNGWFQQETEGMGSGFIINEEGYILTNYHVIDGAKEVTVTLSDGREVTASVVNYDSDKDIAMIKINEEVKVPGVVELGDSDALQPGEEVVAIGNPLSKELSSTLTKGIISALNRNVETQSGVSTNLIQTDTAINAGNSGGPLINTKGQVIGINTLKLSGSGIEGIGFAIPINSTTDITSQLIQYSKVKRPFIGISGIDLDETTAKKYNLVVGIYVKSVEDFSSAEKGGLKAGDVIIEADGKSIKSMDELNEIKNSHQIGDTMKLKVNRNGSEKEITLTLGEQP